MIMEDIKYEVTIRGTNMKDLFFYEVKLGERSINGQAFSVSDAMLKLSDAVYIQLEDDGKVKRR